MSRELTHALVDALYDHLDSVPRGPVVDWKSPDELRGLLTLDAGPADPVELARLVARHSIQLHHPRYVGHQVCPPFPEASAADFLISALNQSTAVWEMSPAATIIEREVVRWMARKAGYPESAEGTAVSGGSAANLTALLAARARWNADTANAGRRPVVVASSDAHYSVARAAAIMGIPAADVLRVATDEAHRMDVTALEETLAAVEELKDASILAIVATSGSTATGAFDRLDEIALLRDRFRTWLHVDAAHGASAVLSPRFRHLVQGLERADSLSWDPHKMMWMPLSLGTVLVRDGIWLRRAFEADAPYLFHGGSGNLGEMTLQCSKRADAVKLWLVLRSRGVEPIVEALERVAESTRLLYERVAGSSDLEAMHEPELNIFCFRRRDLGDEETAELRERIVRRGRVWLTSTLLRGKRVLRVTIMNPLTSEADLDAVLEEVRTA